MFRLSFLSFPTSSGRCRVRRPFATIFQSNGIKNTGWTALSKWVNISVCSERFFDIPLSERCLNEFSGKQTLGVSQAAISKIEPRGVCRGGKEISSFQSVL